MSQAANKKKETPGKRRAYAEFNDSSGNDYLNYFRVCTVSGIADGI